jgi:hypothetical protein
LIKRWLLEVGGIVGRHWVKQLAQDSGWLLLGTVQHLPQLLLSRQGKLDHGKLTFQFRWKVEGVQRVTHGLAVDDEVARDSLGTLQDQRGQPNRETFSIDAIDGRTRFDDEVTGNTMSAFEHQCRVPARLNIEQVAQLLGFQVHDVPVH